MTSVIIRSGETQRARRVNTGPTEDESMRQGTPGFAGDHPQRGEGSLDQTPWSPPERSRPADTLFGDFWPPDCQRINFSCVTVIHHNRQRRLIHDARTQKYTPRTSTDTDPCGGRCPAGHIGPVALQASPSTLPKSSRRACPPSDLELPLLGIYPREISR